MKNLNKEFWEERYKSNQTGWNIGYPSTPIVEFSKTITDKGKKILIPGAGNAYEAEYLFHSGFDNIYICDIADAPLKNFKERCPDFPEEQLLLTDFFGISKNFDIVLEQTFFCALPVNRRTDYAEKMNEIIVPGGILAGLLFIFPLTTDGPPFGGSKTEYLTYFSPYFKIEKMELCYNSIKPREGNELFFKLINEKVNDRNQANSERERNRLQN